MNATEAFDALPEVARARFAWRLDHPSPDEVVLNFMHALMPAVGSSQDVSIPETAGSVLAFAQAKRDRLETAYRGLVE
jgi:hypothetical protein